MELMESMFVAEEDHANINRTAFFQHFIHSFPGCSYISLWSHHHHHHYNTSCLIYLDGVYTHPARARARARFDAYRESIHYVDHGRFPGFAFKNNLPYIEFKVDCLLRFASSQLQLQFYKEAGIKIVVFMGCSGGEIELGLSTESQVDLRMEIEKWFPLDFSRGSTHLDANHNSHTASSSLSLSGDTTSNYSYSYPYNNVDSNHAYVIGEPIKEAFLVQQSVEPSFRPAAFTIYRKENSTAFNDKKYSPQRQHYSMFKRSVLFFRKLSVTSITKQGNRPMPTQVHHMISERRRREKLNESFQVLRSLLPPGSKKDKASVLSTITNHLSSLKSQVDELQKKNQELELLLSSANVKVASTSFSPLSSFPMNQTTSIKISNDLGVRVMNLIVDLRSRECGMLDLTSKILNLLKERRNVSLISIKSITTTSEANLIRGLELRFKVEV
ncbi:putative transcription factor bHLH041 isoform X2 [Andrographis paniculata]|uniref:putative transcription factor bHLH041 isoform X2 n=1 Tax=Andrographis paniculata TaxID=175694 RepID=UPI0021E9282E|nr:putative transcription factor bHLH041 isoform X2 [Andrographis paniculata]